MLRATTCSPIRSYLQRCFSTNNFVTGSWETIKYNGHPANSFVPAPLPPTLNLSFRHANSNQSLHEIISDAEKNIQELNTKSASLPNSLMSSFLKKEAVLSNQIDLNSKTMVNVLKEVCRFSVSTTAEDRTDLNAITKYIEGYQKGQALLSRDKAYSIDLLESVYKKINVEKPNAAPLTSEANVHKLRTSQIGSGSASACKANHLPPSPEHVRGLTENLLQYLNSTKNDIPALAQFAVAHAQLEAIHPFTGSNGSLSRLMLMLGLTDSGVLKRFNLYPSYAFKVCRWSYFNCLHELKATGRWENWLHFFVSAISHSAIDAIELTEDLTRMHDKHKQILTQHNGGVINQSDVDRMLDLTYRWPYLDQKAVLTHFDENYCLVNELLNLFTRVGLLEVLRNDKQEIWYHNKSLVEELNKERHIASYATMMEQWMQVPANKETIEVSASVHCGPTGFSYKEETVVYGSPRSI